MVHDTHRVLHKPPKRALFSLETLRTLVEKHTSIGGIVQLIHLALRTALQQRRP